MLCVFHFHTAVYKSYSRGILLNNYVNGFLSTVHTICDNYYLTSNVRILLHPIYTATTSQNMVHSRFLCKKYANAARIPHIKVLSIQNINSVKVLSNCIFFIHLELIILVSKINNTCILKLSSPHGGMIISY